MIGNMFDPHPDDVRVVRCEHCVHRGDHIVCPMCFEEQFFDRDCGYEYTINDRTEDRGYCHIGERRKYQ